MLFLKVSSSDFVNMMFEIFTPEFQCITLVAFCSSKQQENLFFFRAATTKLIFSKELMQPSPSAS